MSVDADTYMPEFWPADRILGLILDEQIEGVEASKIVGLIVNDQVAQLAAEKITGKLTQEQIETIAATQITGKLTDAQLEEIAAAKIVGTLTDSQLGGLSAAKIIGQIATGQIKSVSSTIIEGKLTSAQITSLEAAKITGKLTNAQIEALEAAKITGKITSAQIASLEAALITGQLTNAQIASIEAAKLTGQITNTQIKGLESGKLEGLLTSEQIANLAVAKLVGQISESQIAAKAVTAGKINVAELSAISVNAGVIEAGIFKGVTFETAKGETVFDKEGIRLVAPENEEPKKTRRIEWFDSAKNLVAWLGATFSKAGEANGVAKLVIEAIANTVSKNAEMVMRATNGTSKQALIRLLSPETAKKIITLTAGEISKYLFTSEEESHFVQTTDPASEPKKRRINSGTSTVEFKAKGLVCVSGKIAHGIGVKPTSIDVTFIANGDHGIWSTPLIDEYDATNFVVAFRNDSERAAGIKFTILWKAYA